MGPETTPATRTTSEQKRKRLISRVVFAVGVALLIGAGWMVYTHSPSLSEPIESLRVAHPAMIALALIAPVLNVVAVSLCFHALMNRVGRVGLVEMTELIGSAWLLNHLPMRPGLIGRLGYHARVNKIPLRDCLSSTVWSVVGAVAANAAMLAWALWSPGIDAPAFSLVGVLAALVPSALFFGAAAVVPKDARLLTLAFAYRSLDVWVWYGRYALAFHLLGAPIAMHEAAAISAVSQLATLIPLTGSGLGFREWGVGLSTRVSGGVTALGIAADLINRAAETLVVIPVGLVCSAGVARRVRRARLSEHDAHAQPHDDRPQGDDREQDPPDP